MDTVEHRTALIVDKKIQIQISETDKKAWNELNVHFISEKNGLYFMPLLHRHIKKLRKLNFELSTELNDWAIKREKRIKKERKVKIEEIENLKGQLYPYQVKGVNFIDAKKGRALIADEMGLGKTVQSLAWLQLRKSSALPALIVCPSSLKINWKREAEKWMSDIEVVTLNGQTPFSIEAKNDIVIINYDILPYWVKDLQLFSFRSVIADEFHYIKSNSAKRTKAFKRIVKQIPHVIGLTGTPIENRPEEIYNIINVIDPTLFPSWWEFTEQFCGRKRTAFGWDTSGGTNLLELNQILKESIMIRRKKDEVLKDLPKKRLVSVVMPLTNKKEYQLAENELVMYLRLKYEKLSESEIDEETEKQLIAYAKEKDINVSNGLTQEVISEITEAKLQSTESAFELIKLKELERLSIQGKMNPIIEWVEEFLLSGEKLVLFAHNRNVIQTLKKRFKNASVVMGGMSDTERQKQIDRFQNEKEVKLFLGNIKAAGVGITLTAASNVAVTQFPWSPSAYNQAVDRVHRITQTKSVTVWNIIGENTVDEKILKILAEKEKMIQETLDGKIADDESSFLSALVNDYLKI